MSESIDWSDPSKLQRRDGGKVIACGKTDTGIKGEEYWAVTELPQGGPAVALYWRCGRYTMGIESDRDIIGPQREPMSVVMFMYPEIFTTVSCRETNWTACNQPKCGAVKVRITEVIE